MPTNKSNTVVAAGKLFCFSEGEYSDYGYVGHFLALEDVTPATFEAVKARILEKIRAGLVTRYGETVTLDDDEADISRALRDHFLPELIRIGVVMEIDCTEIHLGSYGRLELDVRSTAR